MKANDEAYMQHVLNLAARAKGRTSPNPMVGALIVRDGKIIGEGYHQRAGSFHAEVHALNQAKDQAKGADLYVNLEPCCHHGRTPPCAERIAEAGIARVIVGMVDPNPLVDGCGIRYLQKQGIHVDVGICERECRALNEAFILSITEKRPHITYKAAITLDGHVATRNGHARWVSSEESRAYGHRLRNELDAIIAGVGTIVADDPSLNCRDVEQGRDPIRIVFDRQLRTPNNAKILKLAREGKSETWLIHGPNADPNKIDAHAKIQLIEVEEKEEGIDLAKALTAIYQKGVVSALLEGGPTLAGTFWREKLIDKMIAFVAPKVLGDPHGLPMISVGHKEKMSQATFVDDIQIERAGDDIVIIGKPRFNDDHENKTSV